MNDSEFVTLFGRAPFNKKNPMVFADDEDMDKLIALAVHYKSKMGTKRVQAAFRKIQAAEHELDDPVSSVALQVAFQLAEVLDKKKHADLLKRTEYGVWQDICATVRKGEMYPDFAGLARCFCASARDQLWKLWCSPGVHGFVVYQNQMLGAAGSGSVAAVRFGPACEAKTLETLLAAERIGDVPSRFKQQSGHLVKTPREIELCEKLSQ